MKSQTIAESEAELYNDLREEPCILCGDPYAYVLGSFQPEELKRSTNKQYKAPVLYYTLCEQCFNNGRISTARIEGAYKKKFGKMAA
jgi:hypothetical protein